MFAFEMLAFDLLGIAVAFWVLGHVAPDVLPWGVILAQPLWLVWAGRSLVFERFDLAPAVLMQLAIALLADWAMGC
jgi:low temperature requirement protein LtrA